MRRDALRDDQWDRIKDILPKREDHVGVTAKDNRLFVEAVLYRYRAGIRGGICRSALAIRSRSTRGSLAERCVEKVFDTLAADADNEYPLINSTIMRAQHSAGAQKN